MGPGRLAKRNEACGCKPWNTQPRAKELEQATIPWEASSLQLRLTTHHVGHGTKRSTGAQPMPCLPCCRSDVFSSTLPRAHQASRFLPYESLCYVPWAGRLNTLTCHAAAQRILQRPTCRTVQLTCTHPPGAIPLSLAMLHALSKAVGSSHLFAVCKLMECQTAAQTPSMQIPSFLQLTSLLLCLLLTGNHQQRPGCMQTFVTTDMPLIATIACP